MQRIALNDSLEFSRIIYGMWRLADDTDTRPEHVTAKIETCLDHGITTFDQADIYGGYTSEAVLGAALRSNPGLRNRMEIITKCDIIAPAGRFADAPVKYYDTSRAHIMASVETSLREMGITHIDMLLIHRPDPMMDHAETGAALDELVGAGKVRSVGVSNFRPWDWDLLQSAMKTPLLSNQIEISLGHIEPFTNGDLAFHQRQSHPIMAWSPLGGGALMDPSNAAGQMADALADIHNVDRAAIAIAFLLAHPARILPVLGTNTPARIANMCKACDVALTRPEWFQLYSASLGAEVP